MKKVLAMVLALAMAFSLTACGGSGMSDQGTSGSGAGSTGEVKEMDMFWFSDGGDTAAMQKLIDQYQTENPNIKINLIEIPFEDIQNKIMVSVSGGTPPRTGSHHRERHQFHQRGHHRLCGLCGQG